MFSSGSEREVMCTASYSRIGPLKLTPLCFNGPTTSFNSPVTANSMLIAP